MPEMKDPKITVERDIGKTIAQTIVGEIKNSFTDARNDKRYKLMKRCENQYNQITKWMAANKTCTSPWKNASDYFIPLTEWIIDAVAARIDTTLFSQEPYMTARGTEAADVPKQEGVTDFVDMALREIVKLRQNILFFFKQMIKLPFAVLKYDWQQDFDRMILKEDAIVFVNPMTGEKQQLLPDDPNIQGTVAELMANGYQEAGKEPVWVAQDKELINAPQLRYIRAEDYVYCPNAKRGTRLYWEGDRCWFTINEMRLKVEQDKFIKESVDAVASSINYGDKSGADKVIAQRAELRECFHWFGRLPFNKDNEIDLEDKDAIEQEVYCVVDYKDEELLEIMHWPYRRIPWPDRVYIRGEFEETEEFEGRSLAQKLYMTNREMNDFWNMVMNNAWIAMQKIFVKKKDLTGGAAEKPKVFPGAMWEEDQAGDVRVLDVGDVKQMSMQFEQMFINFAERISNISIYQTGTSREKGQKTLGEVQATIREGNIGLDRFMQNCHQILRKVCQWTVDYYYDRMPPGLERRIRGEQDEMIFPTPENMMMYNQKGINPQWREDDIAGKFDFTWLGTSLNSDKEWKLAVADDMMDRYLPHPMVAGNLLATWEILKQGLLARGQKDWQKILPPKQAIVQEMQMMQQQAQVRKVVKGQNVRV